MKIKSDFVTNSSSASFVIGKYYVSGYQRDLIFNHEEIAEDQAWEISENHDTISGYTNMDNFDMYAYLESIGIPMEYLKESKY
jgi:hypothetical protein